jgi:hypothetical protein
MGRVRVQRREHTRDAVVIVCRRDDAGYRVVI